MNGINIADIRVLSQEPCQISHFSILSNQVEISYNQLNVSNKMCLSSNQNLSISQSTNGTYKMLSVQVVSL